MTRPIYRSKRPRTADGHRRLIERLTSGAVERIAAAEAKRRRRQARNLAIAMGASKQAGAE